MCHYAQCKIKYRKNVDVTEQTNTEGQIIILRGRRMEHKNNKQNCLRSKSRSKGNNNFDIKNKISDLGRRNAWTLNLCTLENLDTSTLTGVSEQTINTI